MRSRSSSAIVLLSLVAASTESAAPAAEPPALTAAVADWAKDRDEEFAEAPPAYRFALVDLNGDGHEDALVLITDNYFCGTGGCTLLVLKAEAGRFDPVSTSTISREPMWLTSERQHGWRTFSLLVAGGGLEAYQAAMRFDGIRYPPNPSDEPVTPRALLQSAKPIVFLAAAAPNKSLERSRER
jgi:hypothetical protein